ncbi:MAG: TonB-dependent receptor [Flavobacteriales bacterium]
MNTLRNGTVLLMLGIGGASFAQSMGEIHGKVVDEAGQPEPFASVSADQGTRHFNTKTDDDGNFVLKPLPIGSYDVMVMAMGKNKVVVTGVRVDADLINRLAPIEVSSIIKEVEIIGWKDPLIRPDDPSRMTMTAVQIKKNPLRKDPVKMIATFNPGVTKAPNGDGLYFRGSRTDAMAYYVDGVKVTGALTAVPSDAINSISVYTGGLPAKYGDVTGGVIAIETKSYFDLYQQHNVGIR